MFIKDCYKLGVLIVLFFISCSERPEIQWIHYNLAFVKWSKTEEIVFHIVKETAIHHPEKAKSVFSNTMEYVDENYGLLYVDLSSDQIDVVPDTSFKFDSSSSLFTHDTIYSFDSSLFITYYPVGTIDSFLVGAPKKNKPIVTIPSFFSDRPEFKVNWAD